MLRFAPNLYHLFLELPLRDRFAKVAKIGNPPGRNEPGVGALDLLWMNELGYNVDPGDRR